MPVGVTCSCIKHLYKSLTVYIFTAWLWFLRNEADMWPHQYRVQNARVYEWSKVTKLIYSSKEQLKKVKQQVKWVQCIKLGND